MAVERTLSIIKPDAVGKNAIGAIYSRFEAAGLQIVAARMMHLSRAQAGGFYAEHEGRPFFEDLIAFMTSGPVMRGPDSWGWAWPRYLPKNVSQMTRVM